MKQYISDVITDYLNWRPGNAYLISAQTGSGKSYFVFEKLLKNAVKYNKYVVYLCNRKSLQNQMKEALEPTRIPSINYNITEEERKHILFLTYQYCETTNQFPNFKVKDIPPRMSRSDKYKMSLDPDKYTLTINECDVLYYVFDEAHYFVSDSTFNVHTNYWSLKNMLRRGSISVFLTATPEPLLGYAVDCCLNEIHTTKSYMPYTDSYIDTSELYDAPRLHMEEVFESAKIISNNRRIIKAKESLPINLPQLQLIQVIIPLFDIFGLKRIEFHFNSTEAIKALVDSCGYPFYRGMWFVEYSRQYYQNKNKLFGLNFYFLKSRNDYSYINPIYFEEFDELIDDIVASDKQWVVFVETTKVGHALADKLNSKNCKAVFVSAPTRNQIKGGVKDTLLEIAECESFNCKVLISTSVLDCGINLKNANIENIVIEQSEKTEFLQMIGRVRASENQQINLYIKAFSLQRIQQLINQLERKLRFLAYNPIQKIEKQSMTREEKRLASSLIFETFSKDKGGIDYQLSRTAYIYCLYALYDYIEAKVLASPSISRDFYIKQQLKWLDKEYEPARWYKYQERRQKVVDILKEAKAQGFLDVAAQNAFCKRCIDAIIQLPETFLSPNMLRFKKEYKRKCDSEYYAYKKISTKSNGKKNLSKTSLEERILPKKEFLNRCFEHLDFPYVIESRQKTINGERMTCWRVKDKEDHM